MRFSLNELGLKRIIILPRGLHECDSLLNNNNQIHFVLNFIPITFPPNLRVISHSHSENLVTHLTFQTMKNNPTKAKYWFDTERKLFCNKSYTCSLLPRVSLEIELSTFPPFLVGWLWHMFLSVSISPSKVDIKLKALSGQAEKPILRSDFSRKRPIKQFISGTNYVMWP